MLRERELFSEPSMASPLAPQGTKRPLDAQHDPADRQEQDGKNSDPTAPSPLKRSRVTPALLHLEEEHIQTVLQRCNAVSLGRM